MKKQNKNTQKSDLKHDLDLNQVIFIEVVDAMYKALFVSSVANMIIGTTLVLMLWHVIERQTLIIWLCVMIGLNIIRTASHFLYMNSSKTLEQYYLYEKIFFVLVMLTALAWSSVSIWLLPDSDSVYHYLPILILIGISAGAITSLGFNIKYITIYFFLLLTPIFVLELLQELYLSNLIAGLTVLFALVALSNAKRFNLTFVENISLRYHAESREEELMVSKNAAIDANKVKGQFISMMSHELRTPLNAILGFGQLLQMSDNPKLSDEQIENTQDIIDAGNFLLSLIEELLDVSSIESNKLKLFIDDVSLSDSLVSTLKLLMPVAKQRNIEIINKCDQDYLVKADSKRLKQIFINFISNAIKYNHENGKINISLEETKNAYIKVFVSDTGKGLTSDQINGLYQPFQRYDHKREGLGLGLYITKNMIELMGGNTGVESTIGEGATFWFELPLAQI